MFCDRSRESSDFFKKKNKNYQEKIKNYAEM
jgi:hypothetical protein